MGLYTSARATHLTRPQHAPTPQLHRLPRQPSDTVREIRPPRAQEHHPPIPRPRRHLDWYQRHQRLRQIRRRLPHILQPPDQHALRLRPDPLQPRLPLLPLHEPTPSRPHSREPSAKQPLPQRNPDNLVQRRAGPARAELRKSPPRHHRPRLRRPCSAQQHDGPPGAVWHRQHDELLRGIRSAGHRDQLQGVWLFNAAGYVLLVQLGSPDEPCP
jgi:hypothetical protein